MMQNIVHCIIFTNKMVCFTCYDMKYLVYLQQI